MAISDCHDSFRSGRKDNNNNRLLLSFLLPSSSSSSSSSSMLKMVIVCFFLLVNPCTAVFYLPGVNPQSFAAGDIVKLKVNKMTSEQTQMDLDYYRLPFCSPAGGPRMDDENMGEFLSGDRIESSPYLLFMKRDTFCEQLCISNLGRDEVPGMMPNKSVKAIRKEYHHNWIVDNLPSASKFEDDATVTTRYWGGFPVGFYATSNSGVNNILGRSHYGGNDEYFRDQILGEDPTNRNNKNKENTEQQKQRAYINNHVNIEIMYHPVEDQMDKYRVVRFTVEPFSIKHDFVPIEDFNIGSFENKDIYRNIPVATIKNPIASCNPDIPIDRRTHTNYEMVTDFGREFQPASGIVLFTYDVTWIQNDVQHWANRWDIYLTMDDAIPDIVHWRPIILNVILLCVLSAVIIKILHQNLEPTNSSSGGEDMEQQYELLLSSSMTTNSSINNGSADNNDEDNNGIYNLMPQQQENQHHEATMKGWRSLHDYVFCKPSFSPLLFCVCCGTGAQLLCTAFLVILFSILGFLNPARRGSRITFGVLAYCWMGIVSGYVATRFYKSFHKQNQQQQQEQPEDNGTKASTASPWKYVAKYSTLGFSGICFSVYILIDLVYFYNSSTDAVPLATIFILIMLWFGISAPMVYLGAYFGDRKGPIMFPVEMISDNPPTRDIPTHPYFYKRAPFIMMLGGVLPYLSGFTELYYINASLWDGYFYYSFFFLFLVYILMIMTCSATSILADYYLLSYCGDHRWWWHSFGTAGSSAIYVFLHSLVQFERATDANSAATYFIFFGFMGLACLGLSLITGFVGVVSSLWFNMKLFRSLTPE